MQQLSLLGDQPIPAQPGVDLRLSGVSDVLADPDLEAPTLVTADPPWSYRFCGVAQGVASAQYDLLTEADIAAHIRDAYAVAAEDSYLLLWCTWPKLAEWLSQDSGEWRYLSGGCWGKTDRLGVGFHWRGDSEPLLLYAKGNPRPRARDVSNLHCSARTQHSEKPVAFLRSCLRAFSSPDDLVLDLYAGMAPMGRACLHEGRRYVGAEIDPERHRQASAKLAQWRHHG